MSKRAITLVGIVALLLGAYAAMPAYGQVEVQDLGFQNKAVEPGDAIFMDHTTVPATLGSGVVIMRFKVTDVDPLADDPSDVTITGMTVENLGSADETDIIEVMCLDQDGNALAPVVTPVAGPNPNIAFTAFCDIGTFIIPDNGSETFDIAVRTADTTTLADDDQGNTLALRVIINYTETVGSPPVLSTFTAMVTDGASEFIWNGGINSWTDDTYVINPLMPGQQGVVSRFTVCDDDSNEHNLIISSLTIKQGDLGTALYTDIATLKVFRVENKTRTMVGTLVPDVAFDRGGPGDLLLFPSSVFLLDDHCTTFEVEAQVSLFAFKGKLIQLEFQIATEEPVASPIDPSVDPEVKTRAPTVIGKGLIEIPDTIVLGSPGEVPLNVAGIPLPGLGALQVGPTGAFTYDPSVIRVRDIVGVAVTPSGDLKPADQATTEDTVIYCVPHKDKTKDNGGCGGTIPDPADGFKINNRTGELTFTVLIDPAQADNAFQNGTIAIIKVEAVGNPGERSRLGLIFDQVTDADNNPISGDVGVSVGEVKLVPPGDVNIDGATTISDALLLANELIQSTPCSGLTDEQKLIADVADPKAPAGTVPVCGGDNPHLTSADVAEIARLSISSAGLSSSGAPSRVVPLSVRGVQTAMRADLLTVRVQGEGIAGLNVEVFNLAGRKVLAETAAGAQLRVRLQSEGRPLANGVYLYVVTVKGKNGEALRSEVRKLVVLR